MNLSHIQSDFIAAVLLLSAVSDCGAQKPKPPVDIKVLFIGNSLTAVNNVPGMVEAISRAAGQPRITSKAITMGGAGLEDHWRQGYARRVIAGEHWDFVVLQNGPCSLLQSRATLREYTRQFAGVIRKAGAQPALYMAWPHISRIGVFDQVRDSYRIAADDVKGLFLPAGEAWRTAWKENPNLALYGPDGIHPTAEGSYLAALVIYRGLTGRSVRAIPDQIRMGNPPGDSVPQSPAVGALLKRAAEKVSQLQQVSNPK